MSLPQAEEIEALGRPFTLGYLYDIRTDAIINQSLWDYAELQENINSQEQPYTNYTVGVSDTISEKSSLMNVKIGLKFSFLGGLITVRGSAAYLDSKKSSSRVTSVSARWQSTVRTDRLSMEQLQHLKYPDHLDLVQATHVITGITYGADAYFSFEKMVSSTDNKKEVSGNLSVFVNSIPGFELTGSGDVKIDDNMKKNVEDVTCTFYGDFSDIPIPKTYIDAVKVLNMLETTESQFVPVKVYLTPLNSLTTKAEELVTRINEEAVDRASKTKVYLDCVVEMLKGLIMSKTAGMFSSMHLLVDQVKIEFKKQDILFKEQLKSLIPKVREGKENQQAVFDLVEAFEASKFSNQYFVKWQTELESEFDTMDALITNLRKVSAINVIGNEEEFTNLQMVARDGIYVLNASFASIADENVIGYLQSDSAPADYPVNEFNWITDEIFFNKVLRVKENFKKMSSEDENAKFMFVVLFKYGTSKNEISVDFMNGGVLKYKNIGMTEKLNLTTSNDTVMWNVNASVDVAYTKLAATSRYEVTRLAPVSKWQLPSTLEEGEYEVKVKSVCAGGAVGCWTGDVLLQKARDTDAAVHITGKFECHKYDDGGKNDYHYVTITQVGAHTYTWKNRANVSWSMYASEDDGNMLLVDEDCPYYKSGYTKAVFSKKGVLGPWNELYSYEGA